MRKKQFFSTRIITRDAMLAALCGVLGFIALDLGNLKVTFESLPVLLSGFLFGPIEGALVGGIGTFIYQILRYGISATTFLWMFPYILMGGLAGLFISNGISNQINSKRILIYVFALEIMVLIINTGVIYIDSKIYGYYSAAYVFGSLFIRIIICILKSLAFGLTIPLLLKSLRPFTKVNNR